MHICLICSDYPPAERVGGIGVFTQTLARELVKRGHSVSVVSYSKGYEIETEEDDQGVYLLRLPLSERSPLRTTAFTRRLKLESTIRRIIRQRKIDLIECPDVGGSLLIGRFGIPLIVRLHGAINLVHRPLSGQKPNNISALFEKHTLKLADHFVAVSKYVCSATLNAAHLKHCKCELIYNGVNTNVFSPNAGIVRDENRILFVGRISETKGAPYLFRALPMVFDHFPNAYLRFVGKDPIDKFGHHASLGLLAQLSEDHRKRVEMVGEVSHDQIPREYQSAAIAVFPSRAEAHPISVVEAMACATPVVFMNHGPGPEMIDHGVDGFLCDTKSPEAIAEAIMILLADPSQAEHMGYRAAERIKSNLSLTNTVKQNERFFLKCIEAQYNNE